MFTRGLKFVVLYFCCVGRIHIEAQKAGRTDKGLTPTSRPTTPMSDQKYFTVFSGANASLSCVFGKTVRIQRVTWRKDLKTINSTVDKRYYLFNGDLTIFGVRTTDTGWYTCNAQTHSGMRSKTMRLTVVEIPSVRRTMRNITAEEGTPVLLTCDMAGQIKLPMTVAWRRDGYKLSKEKAKNVNSDLQLLNPQIDDSGAYECEVQTQAGKFSTTIQLTISRKCNCLTLPPQRKHVNIEESLKCKDFVENSTSSANHDDKQRSLTNLNQSIHHSVTEHPMHNGAVTAHAMTSTTTTKLPIRATPQPALSATVARTTTTTTTTTKSTPTIIETTAAKATTQTAATTTTTTVPTATITRTEVKMKATAATAANWPIVVDKISTVKPGAEHSTSKPKISAFPGLIDDASHSSSNCNISSDHGTENIQLTQRLVDVALALFKETQNIVLAPHALKQALGLLYLASNGRTKDELRWSFNFPRDDHAFLSATSMLTQCIQADQTRSQLDFRMFNRLYVDYSLGILETYRTLIGTIFSVGRVQEVDFTYKAGAQINHDVKQHTRNFTNILDQNSIDKMDKLVLISTFYFSAPWLYRLQPSRHRNFHTFTADNKKIYQEVEMLETTQIFNYKTVPFEGSIVELPYANSQFSAYFYLPDEASGAPMQKHAEEFLKLLTSSATFMPARVWLIIPKLAVELSFLDLTSFIEGMGALQLFYYDADLSKLSHKAGLKVDKILQKVKIDITKDGSVLDQSGEMKSRIDYQPPLVFHCNRAFFLAILHKPSQTILAIALIRNPAEFSN